MSWAEVKKINSDMNKPLDVLLKEKSVEENSLVNKISSSLLNVKDAFNNNFGFLTNEYGEYVFGYINANTSQTLEIQGKGKIDLSVNFGANRSYSVADDFTVIIDGIENKVSFASGVYKTLGCSLSSGFSMPLFFQESFKLVTGSHSGSYGIIFLYTYRLCE